jgi:hypothetical protein
MTACGVFAGGGRVTQDNGANHWSRERNWDLSDLGNIEIHEMAKSGWKASSRGHNGEVHQTDAGDERSAIHAGEEIHNEVVRHLEMRSS